MSIVPTLKAVVKTKRIITHKVPRRLTGRYSVNTGCYCLHHKRGRVNTTAKWRKQPVPRHREPRHFPSSTCWPMWSPSRAVTVKENCSQGCTIQYLYLSTSMTAKLKTLSLLLEHPEILILKFITLNYILNLVTCGLPPSTRLSSLEERICLFLVQLSVKGMAWSKCSIHVCWINIIEKMCAREH